MPSKKPLLDPHPAITAHSIQRYVSERLNDGSINLYSAFTLCHEATRIHRQSYLQPAWQDSVGIKNLLRIAMDCITAKALACQQESTQAAEWFVHDCPLLSERRPHFLTDRLHQGAALLDDPAFYSLLSELRANYDALSEDDDPFPPDVFPFDYAAPERELLKPGSQPEFACAKDLDEESADIYVEICIAT